MSDSLQQQLIRAGLVSQERAEELSKPKPKRPVRNNKQGKTGKGGSERAAQSKKPAGRGGKPNSPGGPKPAAKRSGPSPAAKKAAKAAKAAELDAKAEAELAAKRELKARIKKLIEDSSITEFSGELTFSYVVGERIRQLFVTQEYLDKVSAGDLAITRLNRQTHLVTPDVAKQLVELNPQWLVVINDPTQEQPVVSGEEDPYADYKVPDDLHW